MRSVRMETRLKQQLTNHCDGPLYNEIENQNEGFEKQQKM